ncbi:hypothetical protein Tco_0814475 [Tanacetum coccineum]
MNTAGAFVRPKGITVNSKCPYQVLNRSLGCHLRALSADDIQTEGVSWRSIVILYSWSNRSIQNSTSQEGGSPDRSSGNTSEKFRTMAMSSSFGSSAFALIKRFTFSSGHSSYTLSISPCGSEIRTTLSWQTILALCLDNQSIPMITSKLLCPNDIWVEEEENMKKMVMMKKIDDLNNEKDEKKWQSMVLEMKIEEIMCSKREIPDSLRM